MRVARVGDVSDGLSNTLLISELAGRPDFYQDGQLVNAYPMEPNADSGCDIAAAAWGMSTSTYWMLSYKVNVYNSRSPYSFHESGANVAFADGSVKFLSKQTSEKILAAMSTRAGGEVASLP